MNKSLGILFYLRKEKVNNVGLCPIYLRITVNKDRAVISIQRFIEPEKWNVAAGKVRGTSDEVKSINAYIDNLRSQLYEHHRKLVEDNKTVTPTAIKNALLGVEEDAHKLIAVFNYHNQQVKELIGKEFAPGTLERYITVVKHLKEFIIKQYKVDEKKLKAQ